MIYSSNNEESLLKSSGPFRITNSGTSFAGSVIPKVHPAGATIIHGKTKLCGKQIAPDESHSRDKKK
jgi:hypothetical protein